VRQGARVLWRAQGREPGGVSQGDEHLDYANVFLVAAARLGVTAFHVRLGDVSPNVAVESGAWAVGTRMFLCMEPVDNLARMFPTRELRRRVEAAEELLGSATEMRFTNPAGTDVTFMLGSYPILTQYGFSDTPGRWDHWPSGFVATSGATTASTAGGDRPRRNPAPVQGLRT